MKEKNKAGFYSDYVQTICYTNANHTVNSRKPAHTHTHAHTHIYIYIHIKSVYRTI